MQWSTTNTQKGKIAQIYLPDEMIYKTQMNLDVNNVMESAIEGVVIFFGPWVISGWWEKGCGFNACNDILRYKVQINKN